jgi:hypothetical protein
MYQFEFSGRAPSAVQIKAQVKKAVASGHDCIELSWGENQITLEHHDMLELWTGFGWIRRVGGDDIAREMNQ